MPHKAERQESVDVSLLLEGLRVPQPTLKLCAAGHLIQILAACLQLTGKGPGFKVVDRKGGRVAY